MDTLFFSGTAHPQSTVALDETLLSQKAVQAMQSSAYQHVNDTLLWLSSYTPDEQHAAQLVGVV